MRPRLLKGKDLKLVKGLKEGKIRWSRPRRPNTTAHRGKEEENVVKKIKPKPIKGRGR